MIRTLFHAASASALLFLLVVFTPLAWYAGEPLRSQASDPQPADAIVLFSSNQIGAEWLSEDAAQRLLGALGLYRRGLAPVVLASGSQHASAKFQAELEATWLERAGVPQSAVVVENRSTRTYESVQQVRDVMQARGWSSVVIVSSDMDILRIRLVCDRLGVRASYLGVPEFAPPAPGAVLYIAHGYPALYHAVYEYAALALYRFKGWI